MKPMLAAATDGTNLTYPKLVSPKLDGVRCLIIDGVAMSRSLKPIPNQWVQKCVGRKELNGLDGELVVGLEFGEGVFQRTSSGVMSHEGKPDIRFLVFDDFSVENTFAVRFSSATKRVNKFHGAAFIVEHEYVQGYNDVLAYEQDCLTMGYEGVMLRSPGGIYKHGRSTLKEGHLLKLKRFVDSEAVVIDVKPLMHNENEAVRNKLGHLERSSKKAGKVATNMMGSLVVRDLKTKVEFELGTGFDEQQRYDFWLHRAQIIAQKWVVKYKSQPVGVKDKPRFPVFLGFRDKMDM